MDELIGFPDDLSKFGMVNLPESSEKRIMDFLTKVNNYNNRMWVPKSTIQSHSGCSHQKTKDILDKLLRNEKIIYAQHGSRIVYKLNL